MKFIYKGNFNGDISTLIHGEHKENAVKFKEADNPKTLGIIANVAAAVIFIALYVLWLAVSKGFTVSFVQLFILIIAMLAALPIHELLHAICFKDEVHLYLNFKNGLLFVVGPETMSKARFVFSALLPNIVLGLLPYVIWLIFPQLAFLGLFGAMMLSSGAGDYYNVFNALTQMPKGAKTYMHCFNSYWYMPKEGDK